jgi:3-hydroxyisobutyrate dehydrogenase
VTDIRPASTAETIGFIGLGHMGAAMAANLVRRGYRVLGWDRDPAARARFATDAASAEPAAIADLAAADIPITMLPTGDVVRHVITDGGGDSLANTLRPGAVVIDTTSSVPDDTRALGALLAARSVAMIDAPVSGARRGALDGTLVFMIGGDDAAALERSTPVLAAMGTRLIRTGPLASGHAMKSLNNYVSAAGFAAACEALVIGGQYGLDPAVMVDVLNVSTGRNFATKVSLPRIVKREFIGTFSLGLFTKDLKIVADMARAAGVTAPLAELVHARMAKAVAVLGGDGDHTTAQLHWERQVAPPAHAEAGAP